MTYDTPEEGKNKTILIVVGVVAGLLILCCCLVVITLAALQFTGTFTLPFLGTSLGETFTYDEDGMKVEFSYPSDWYANENGSFYIGTVRGVEDMNMAEDGEFYMMLYFDETDDNDGDTLAEILEYMIDDMQDYEEALDVSDVKSTKIGGKDGVYVTFSGESQDFDSEIDGKIVIWEISEDFYGIAYGFSGGMNFSKYKGTMDGILDSFTVEIDE